jgi:hypothetical protein
MACDAADLAPAHELHEGLRLSLDGLMGWHVIMYRPKLKKRGSNEAGMGNEIVDGNGSGR